MNTVTNVDHIILKNDMIQMNNLDPLLQLDLVSDDFDAMLVDDSIEVESSSSDNVKEYEQLDELKIEDQNQEDDYSCYTNSMIGNLSVINIIDEHEKIPANIDYSFRDLRYDVENKDIVDSNNILYENDIKDESIGLFTYKGTEHLDDNYNVNLFLDDNQSYSVITDNDNIINNNNNLFYMRDGIKSDFEINEPTYDRDYTEKDNIFSVSNSFNEQDNFKLLKSIDNKENYQIKNDAETVIKLHSHSDITVHNAVKSKIIKEDVVKERDDKVYTVVNNSVELSDNYYVVEQNDDNNIYLPNMKFIDNAKRVSLQTEQIIMQINELEGGKEEHNFSMQLMPSEEFGIVNVDMSFDEKGKVIVNISSEDYKSIEILKNDSHILEQNLLKNNLYEADIIFETLNDFQGDGLYNNLQNDNNNDQGFKNNDSDMKSLLFDKEEKNNLFMLGSEMVSENTSRRSLGYKNSVNILI